MLMLMTLDLTRGVVVYNPFSSEVICIHQQCMYPMRNLIAHYGNVL